ncbi:hypothetical protein CFH99_09180 [Nocardioides aromaticivorans]|uniref:Type 4 fimbrial biogenesis protein PilX N-terminal domain-containing protein n=1 Tax=Nocardioides aromaticivorans TaxID=200618 RepID=A0ABX7PJC4_9ACTN|nr:hypothetical protein [Nocardioides aromaticivorans]QSR25793.1 hypothetical protein CFH99_09180 [Nocardioides aromaticivorans]
MTEFSRRFRDDRGAMLVIALVIITTVAVVTGALLSKSWTNVRATVSLRGVAGTSYAADASAKIAINNLRLGKDAPGWVTPSFPGVWTNWVYTNNADGTGCFGADGTNPDNVLELNNVYPAAGDQTSSSSARVECSQVPGTGLFGAGAGVGVNDPDPTDAFARALTTIGNSGTLQGISLKPLGTGNTAPMPMRGGVASESFIDVDNGALVTDGYVWAEGSCTGQIVGSEKICNSPGKVPTPATPTSPVSSVPSYRDATAQGCTFQPGFYNNASDLSAAVNACGTAYFASGAYYFDFRDADHGGSNTWTISTKVVGGESTGTGTIPGACRSPITNASVTGVQFVFGNSSRMSLSDSAQVELCGPSNSGNAPMTIYQQPTGTTSSSSSVNDVSAATATEQTGSKYNVGVATPNGTSVRDATANADASSVTWTMASNAKNEMGVDYRDFPGLSAIPAGSDVTSAQLRIKYAKTTAQNLTVTVKDQTPANAVVSAPDVSGWGTVDISSQLRDQLERGTFDANKPTLQLRLTGASKDQTVTIDAVKLSVTYVPPSLRAAVDGTLIDAPGGNFQGRFVVQGATFAPHGYINLVPGSSNQALVAFRWGIVALGVAFKAQPPQTFGYPLVSIPDAGTGFGSRVTVVDLKVYVCVQAGSCTSGGRHALTVRVMITDPPYGSSGAPVPGKRKMEVLSWAEQN